MYYENIYIIIIQTIPMSKNLSMTFQRRELIRSADFHFRQYLDHNRKKDEFRFSKHFKIFLFLYLFNNMTRLSC